MNIEKIYNSVSYFSPWVFTTYDCSCRCEYCMIPKMDYAIKYMSSDNFRSMMSTCEKLLNNKIYEDITLRLSGGEPLLAFNNYKDVVTEYKNKIPKSLNFCLFTNLIHLNDEVIEWLKINDIEVVVSLDDLTNSKPLNNGNGTAEIVLKNIEKLSSKKIRMSINTVLDINKNKNLIKMADFISDLNIEWSLNTSYYEDNESKIDEIIKVFDDSFFHLVKKGFDIYNNLRFFNMYVGPKIGGCGVGVYHIAIGVNLEVWACQAHCNQEKLGIFDENIKSTLMNSPLNDYYRKRSLRSECVDCQILDICKGGCRDVHHYPKSFEVTCKIKKNIIEKIKNGYYERRRN